MNQIQSEPVKDEAQRVTIYPIAGLAGSWEDEPFDESKLPAAIVPDVTVENVRPIFKDNAWDLFEGEIGKRDLDVLRRIKHAIVHRFSSRRCGTGEPDQLLQHFKGGPESQLYFNANGLIRSKLP